ncbi:prepilin-type N-terminal cleavage/methylation domain-containing protein [Lacinutrix sp.]|uniref:PulJ/GspJ family protein n=1 Tax=Lacinutrix sp. TaxID=1937692 RepID=UPI0025B816B0|nr:prepilin-type N-terminal cleavage/methylation domain-containing protein [Lacinutrix sp.]
MQTNKKVQAFTLSEMIVVLILTSIVVGLAFSVLGLVQKQMLAIQDNYNKSLELNKLETVLWLDFNRYSKIEYNNLEKELKFSTELDSMTYRFLESKVIKEQDTFAIQLQQKKYYFEGDIISNGQIDALKLETTKDFQNQQLFIFKQNDATVFMN